MKTQVQYRKPLPEITPANQPYWRAAKDHKLVLPRCRECRSWVYPIAPICQKCWSEDVEWEELSGRGRISSWVVFHRAFDPSFEADVPYIVAEIDLDEGIRFVSNILGACAADLKAGMPVEAEFDDVTSQISLVKFRPRS